MELVLYTRSNVFRIGKKLIVKKFYKFLLYIKKKIFTNFHRNFILSFAGEISGSPRVSSLDEA